MKAVVVIACRPAPNLYVSFNHALWLASWCFDTEKAALGFLCESYAQAGCLRLVAYKPCCVHTGLVFWLQAAGSQDSAVSGHADDDLQVCTQLA